ASIKRSPTDRRVEVALAMTMPPAAAAAPAPGATEPDSAAPTSNTSRGAVGVDGVDGVDGARTSAAGAATSFDGTVTGMDGLNSGWTSLSQAATTTAAAAASSAQEDVRGRSRVPSSAPSGADRLTRNTPPASSMRARSRGALVSTAGTSCATRVETSSAVGQVAL